MTPDRAAELKKKILRGSQIAPSRARCSRCLRMFDHGDLLEGRCEQCTQAHREELSQDQLRGAVYERDKGLCAECKIDCAALRSELAALQVSASSSREDRHRWEARLRQLMICGFDVHAVTTGAALWEAAHMTARVQGGANNPSNVRTLCLSCHKDDTAKLARSRTSKKPSKPWRIGR